MSERTEKRRRQNARLEYIERFYEWLASEPPRFRIFKYRCWKRQRPVLNRMGKKQ